MAGVAPRVTAIPLGRTLPHGSSNQPGWPAPHARAGASWVSPRSSVPPLFGLAPGGVCPATPVTVRAVRSYRTFSPLLAFARRLRRSGLFSVALSLGSPPPDVIRHRACVEPGLSSAPGRERIEIRRAQGSGRPAGWCRRQIFRCLEVSSPDCRALARNRYNLLKYIAKLLPPPLHSMHQGKASWLRILLEPPRVRQLFTRLQQIGP